MFRFPFNNQYATLGEGFFSRTQPTPVSEPVLIRFNHELAEQMNLDLDGTSPDQLGLWFSGNDIPEGAEPLSMVYAGHQFGFYTPQLGDGRAILLGDVMGQDGQNFEIQLKGSGRTVYSRNGDGRSPLGPVLREYLVSEAMYRLGVPTTRALAAVATGDPVYREVVLPGGVLTRVASSFVRVGTFEFHARHSDQEGLTKLADYVIGRNFPELSESENPYRALLEEVIKRQASLIAKWMQYGFIHGVMNTDNMSIVGETIDYGPCAFMDSFSINKVFSSIDQQGRYAYSNQPGIALWNLARFAECLALIVNPNLDAAIEEIRPELEKFNSLYEKAWVSGMQAKVGLIGVYQNSKSLANSLIEELLSLMQECCSDFTISFTELSRLSDQADKQDQSFLRQFTSNQLAAQKWLEKWREALAIQGMDQNERQSQMQNVNPIYIPRNHLIEESIRSAEDDRDFSKFHELHEVLKTPFAEQVGKKRYQKPPNPEQEVKQTFCGT
ncbi:MAG: YdiU family protein [Gammaproteobacteria bacterium]|nr:YdiU family protein [Gammaproteobacteria bacterium]MCY4276128.1 YdiU family protein [Gammaproteobacteria bacterium]